MNDADLLKLGTTTESQKFVVRILGYRSEESNEHSVDIMEDMMAYISYLEEKLRGPIPVVHVNAPTLHIPSRLPQAEQIPVRYRESKVITLSVEENENGRWEVWARVAGNKFLLSDEYLTEENAMQKFSHKLYSTVRR